MMGRAKAVVVVIAAAGSAAVLAAMQPEKKQPDPNSLTVQPVEKQPPAKGEQPEGGGEGMQEKPGAAHARLMKLAGEYTATTKISMGGGPPAETTGAATFKATLGGRFLAQTETGTEFGEDFEAFKMYGYNNAAGKYEGVWSYTGSTALMLLTGTSADEGKTVAYEGSFDGGKEGRQKFEITFKEIDGNSFSVTMVAKLPDGTEAARLETTYARKK